MKKLMCAVAALAAGVAMADGIASANIVGYAQTALTNGTKFITSQFVNTTGGDMDIQDIKPASGSDASDSVYISFLTPLGLTEVMYTWIDYAEDPDSRETVTGWADDGDMLVKNKTVAPGSAVWMQCDVDGEAVQTAGQVSTSDVKVLLDKGNCVAVGNPTPVAVDIQDVRPEGEADVSDQVYISFLDKLGLTKVMYTWIDYAEDPDSRETVTGWADDGDMLVKDVKINPGEGVWIQCDDTENDQYLVIPGTDL